MSDQRNSNNTIWNLNSTNIHKDTNIGVKLFIAHRWFQLGRTAIADAISVTDVFAQFSFVNTGRQKNVKTELHCDSWFEIEIFSTCIQRTKFNTGYMVRSTAFSKISSNQIWYQMYTFLYETEVLFGVFAFLKMFRHLNQLRRHEKEIFIPK